MNKCLYDNMGNQPTVEVTIDDERRTRPAGAVTEVYYPSDTVTDVTYHSDAVIGDSYPTNTVTEMVYPSGSVTEVVYPAGAVGGCGSPYRPEPDLVITDNTPDVLIRSSAGTTEVFVGEQSSGTTDIYIDGEICASAPPYVEPYDPEPVVITGPPPYGQTTVYTDNEPYSREPVVVIEDSEPYVSGTLEFIERSYSSSSSSSDDDDY